MYYSARNSIILSTLHPTVALKATQWLDELEGSGMQVLLTDGLRSLEKQASLYAQGRTKSGPIVTNSKPGESFHNYGLSIDFYPCNSRGTILKVSHKPYAEVAKTLGFSWGGDWRSFVDQPHLQYDFGLTIKDLLSGKRPPSETKAYRTDPKAAARRRARRANKTGK